MIYKNNNLGVFLELLVAAKKIVYSWNSIAVFMKKSIVAICLQHWEVIKIIRVTTQTKPWKWN